MTRRGLWPQPKTPTELVSVARCLIATVGLRACLFPTELARWSHAFQLWLVPLLML